jgi:hypothetical protein
MPTKLEDARLQLVDARALLRTAQDGFALAKAETEYEAIRNWGSERAAGENAEARARNILLAIEHQPTYANARGELRVCQLEVDVCEARVNSLLDARRERELDMIQVLQNPSAYLQIGIGADADAK